MNANRRNAFCLATASALAVVALRGRELTSGLAVNYPGDIGLRRDPAAIFADDFESGDLRKRDELRGTLAAKKITASDTIVLFTISADLKHLECYGG